MSRRGFAPEERARLWRGWKKGLTLKEIGESLNRRACSVLSVLRRDGGCEPRIRRRAARSLQALEREEISRGLAAGLAVREIARRLGRAASTVSREIDRNGGAPGYRAADADARAWQRARRPQPCLLARRPRLRNWVAACSVTGRRARSPLALSAHSRMMARCGYRTRRFTAVSLCKRAMC